MSLISRFVERLRGGFEIPDMRHAARSSEPLLVVDIGGLSCRARNWSAGGALIEGFTPESAVGDMVGGTLRWAPHRKPRPISAGYFAASPTPYRFTAEIVRIDAPGVVALRWLDLPDAILRRMEPDQD